jgi:hypothetical protein
MRKRASAKNAWVPAFAGMSGGWDKGLGPLTDAAMVAE